MGAMFTTLFAKIAAVVAWLGALAVAVFTAASDLIKDMFSWAFEEILKVVVLALGAIDLGPLTSAIQSAGSLPGDVLNILGLLGVGSAIAVITAAIVVRITLQLIPFTRLGS